MAWKVKLDDAGAAVLKDGIPVWIDETSKTESAFNVDQMHEKILSLGRESKQRRERVEELERLLKPTEGIENLEAFLADARKAIETVQNLKEKDLEKADRVEKLKAEMKQTYTDNEAKIKAEFKKREAELAALLDSRAQQIRRLVVSNKFATSELFAGETRKTTLTPRAAEALFGPAFKVEEQNGEVRLVAYHKGEPIYSRTRAGEIADFDEAIQALVERDPDRDQIVRAQSGGSGAAGGTSGTGVAKRGSIPALEERLKVSQNPAERIALTNEIHKLRQAQQIGGGST